MKCQQLKKHIKLYQLDTACMPHEGLIHSLMQVPMLSYEEFLLNYGEIFTPSVSDGKSGRVCEKSPRLIYDLYVMGYEKAPMMAKIAGISE